MQEAPLAPDAPPPLPAWRRADVRLFTWLGAGHGAGPLRLRLAIWTAHWSWVPLVALLAFMAWQQPGGLKQVGLCLAVATAVQVLSKRLCARWRAPRPFLLGLSPNHLRHGDRAGFPSTHAMVMGAILGFLAPTLGPGLPLAGVALIALGTGWARVYAGAHFPSDVAAGLLAGALIGAGMGLALLP